MSHCFGPSKCTPVPAPSSPPILYGGIFRGGIVLANTDIFPHVAIQRFLQAVIDAHPRVWNALSTGIKSPQWQLNDTVRVYIEMIVLTALMLIYGVLTYAVVPPIQFLNKFIHDIRSGTIFQIGPSTAWNSGTSDG
jgi:hypothetical protein